MNGNVTPEAKATPTKLDMDVRVYPSKTQGNLLAYAIVTLGGCFVVKGIRVMNSEKSAFVAMPDRKDSKGEHHEVCFPTTAEMWKVLNTAVMGEYQKVMELLSNRGTQTRSSVRDAFQNAAKMAAECPDSDTAKAPKQHKMDR